MKIFRPGFAPIDTDDSAAGTAPVAVDKQVLEFTRVQSEPTPLIVKPQAGDPGYVAQPGEPGFPGNRPHAINLKPEVQK